MDRDRARLEACFDRHYGAVLRFLRRRLDSPEDAEDAATEVFAVACRRLDQLPLEPETLLWLYAVARNVVANQQRAVRRRTALHQRLVQRRATAVSDPFDRIDRANAVAIAFRSLSAADRELLSLVAWEGLTTTEIATVLRLPRPAVSARLYRARLRLASRLAEREAPVPEGVPGSASLIDGVEHA